MGRIKVGLTAVIVVAALAMAAGTGSAAAANTRICESSTPICTSHPYVASSKFEVVGQIDFEGTGFISCGLEWEFEIGLNNKPVVQARALAWSMSCGGGHTAVALGTMPWTMRLTTTSGGNGIGEIDPWISQPFEIDGCVYEATTLPLKIEGGGWITASGVTLTPANILCPGSATLTMWILSSKPIPMFWMEN
jgi:hypothetical protein